MNRVLISVLIFLLIAIGAFLMNIKPVNGPELPATDDIYEMEDKIDLIRNIDILPGDFIESPLTITGEARGYWYFEASFPVVLVNWDGLIIAQGIATAQDEWMTEDFVPFEVTLEFESPVFENAQGDHFSRRGALIFQKDNPSGLPEFDDALEIPIRFQ